MYSGVGKQIVSIHSICEVTQSVGYSEVEQYTQYSILSIQLQKEPYSVQYTQYTVTEGVVPSTVYSVYSYRGRRTQYSIRSIQLQRAPYSVQYTQYTVIEGAVLRT